MVAALVSAKAGTEMASQIAVMRIREEIDALTVMAVNPHWFLITPRLYGIIIVLPALTVLSIFTLIGSAWLVAVLQLGLNGSDFLIQASQAMTGLDLIYCCCKAMVFGTLICITSCYFGFHSDDGPKGVGNATNMAVVVSAIACVLINYALSEWLYG